MRGETHVRQVDDQEVEDEAGEDAALRRRRGASSSVSSAFVARARGSLRRTHLRVREEDDLVDLVVDERLAEQAVEGDRVHLRDERGLVWRGRGGKQGVSGPC